MSFIEQLRASAPYQWAYQVKKRLLQARREQIASILFKLPPYTVPPASPAQVSIHMLTNRSDWLGALWSVRTFLSKLGEPLPVFFHDDGTIPPLGAARMQAFLPGSLVLSPPQAQVEAECRLAAYPRCLQARSRHVMLYKLLDVPLFAQGDRCLLLDSDLLFFRYPSEIAQWLRGTDRVNLWNKDQKNYMNVTAEQAWERHGIKLVERINAGCGCVWRESLDLDFLEDYFGYDSVWLPKPYNAEQTAFALLSSRFGTRFLSPAYMINTDRTMGVPADLVMKHYVGAVRDLFFSEGIKLLKAQGFIPPPR